MTGPDDDPRLHPPPGELADEDDELDWDRERDGRMRDYAAADDTIVTVPWDGEEWVRRRRNFASQG